MVYCLSGSQAIRLVLASQGLHCQRDFGQGRPAVLKIMERLGYVQIDTISVVERAHHHTLWNRVNRYQTKHLDALLRDREIFEYWSHAAAYLPMTDYRYSLPRKHAIASGQQHWYAKDLKLARFVLDRINAEGPLQAKDFEHAKGAKPGGWWDWKPAKRALEQLFMEGELMVSHREGFQKVYDLTERVLPAGIDVSMPRKPQFLRYLVQRYLAANGFGTAEQIAYLRKGIKKNVLAQCQKLLEDKQLVQVEVGGKRYFALPDFEQTLQRPLSRRKVKILSPFDNVLIQRKRTREIFRFDYQIECYVPAAKRVHGYFVLPLLWGQKFAGRLDAKIDRKTRTLHLLHLHLETNKHEEFMRDLAEALVEFLGFNDGDTIKIERISVNNGPTPAALRRKLAGMIENIQVI